MSWDNSGYTDTEWFPMQEFSQDTCLSIPAGLRQMDISCKQFKWLLKTHSFGHWDRSACIYLVKLWLSKFSYLLTFL